LAQLRSEYNEKKPQLDFTGSYNDVCYLSVLGDYNAALLALDECRQSSTQLWPEWMNIDPDLEGLRNAHPDEFGEAVEQAALWRRAINPRKGIF
jgi:hypothetical protein